MEQLEDRILCSGWRWHRHHAVPPFAGAVQVLPDLWAGVVKNTAATSTEKFVLTKGAVDLAFTESVDQYSWTVHAVEGTAAKDFVFASQSFLDVDLTHATGRVSLSLVGTTRGAPFFDHAFVPSVDLRFGSAGADVSVANAFVYGPALGDGVVPHFYISAAGNAAVVLTDVYVYGNATIDLGGHGSVLTRDDFWVRPAPYRLPGGGTLTIAGV